MGYAVTQLTAMNWQERVHGKGQRKGSSQSAVSSKYYSN